MKRKLFALALALLLVLSLAACGGSKSAEFTAEATTASADMAYPMEPGMAEQMGFDFGSTASGGRGGESRRRGRLEDPPAIGGPVRREQAEAVAEKSGVEQELLSSAGKRYGKLDV